MAATLARLYTQERTSTGFSCTLCSIWMYLEGLPINQALSPCRLIITPACSEKPRLPGRWDINPTSETWRANSYAISLRPEKVSALRAIRASDEDSGKDNTHHNKHTHEHQITEQIFVKQAIISVFIITAHQMTVWEEAACSDLFHWASRCVPAQRSAVQTQFRRFGSL